MSRRPWGCPWHRSDRPVTRVPCDPAVTSVYGVTCHLSLFTLATYDLAMTAQQEQVQVLSSLWHQARAEEREDAVAQLERERELTQLLTDALNSKAS